jgi:hypothetical protein
MEAVEGGRCFVCGNQQAKRCGGCGGLRSYCSADCQRRDWPTHKHVCKHHAAVKAMVDPINRSRGACFKTFLSEMSLEKRTTAHLVTALMTISTSSCYVSPEVATKATELIASIDGDGAIRKGMDPSVVKKLLE